MAANQNAFCIYNDEELMLFITNGEVLAFDTLYTRYSKPLMSYFFRMLNFDKNLAEDALQDLFLKIAEAPEKFDRARCFKTWIFSIASNTCKNYFRHKKVVNNSHAELEYLKNQALNYEFTTATFKIDINLFNKQLEEVLNRLPYEKKEAFILKYQEDKSITEIAEIQDSPEGTVKSRIFYTTKLLEEKLIAFKPTF